MYTAVPGNCDAAAAAGGSSLDAQPVTAADHSGATLLFVAVVGITLARLLVAVERAGGCARLLRLLRRRLRRCCRRCCCQCQCAYRRTSASGGGHDPLGEAGDGGMGARVRCLAEARVAPGYAKATHSLGRECARSSRVDMLARSGSLSGFDSTSGSSSGGSGGSGINYNPPQVAITGSAASASASSGSAAAGSSLPSRIGNGGAGELLFVPPLPQPEPAVNTMVHCHWQQTPHQHDDEDDEDAVMSCCHLIAYRQQPEYFKLLSALRIVESLGDRPLPQAGAAANVDLRVAAIKGPFKQDIRTMFVTMMLLRCLIMMVRHSSCVRSGWLPLHLRL